MSLLPLNNIITRWRFGLGIIMFVFLCGGLVTALIPLRYTGTAIVTTSLPARHINDIQTVNDVIPETHRIQAHIDKEIETITSSQAINALITRLNLINHDAFNPSLKENQALTTKIYHAIKRVIDQKQRTQPDGHAISHAVKKSLRIYGTQSHDIIITYTTHSRPLARVIPNELARAYERQSSLHVTRKVKKEAKNPEKISTPDIKNALYCTAICAAILSLIGMLYIKPR